MRSDMTPEMLLKHTYDYLQEYYSNSDRILLKKRLLGDTGKKYFLIDLLKKLLICDLDILYVSIRKPLQEMPLYIYDKRRIVKIICRWRLEVGK